MVLDSYRNVGDRILTPIARPMRKINPDILSVIAFLFAFLAGFSFYLTNFMTELLLLAGLFIFLNAFFDALDGRVAKISGKASKKGDFLDHVLDRYADVFILGGIIFKTLLFFSLTRPPLLYFLDLIR